MDTKLKDCFLRKNKNKNKIAAILIACSVFNLKDASTERSGLVGDKRVEHW